jgi:N-acetylglutamate synthase
MTNSALGDEISSAYQEVSEVTSANTSGYSRRGTRDTALTFVGTPIAGLNAVRCIGSKPDAAEVAEFADELAGKNMPWSIQTRGEPGPEVVRIASAHGLTERSGNPMMMRRAGADGPRRPVPDGVRVRAVGADESPLYRRLLSACFEAPLELCAVIGGASLLAAEAVRAYVLDVDGVAVATGLSARAGGYFGMYNIAVVPEHRRKGYGRIMTEAVLRDGYDAGAHTAILTASEDGMHLYESMGFETVIDWTYLTAA